MIREDSLEAGTPGQPPAPPRHLTAAETLARALGTAPALDSPDPPEPPSPVTRADDAE